MRTRIKFTVRCGKKLSLLVCSFTFCIESAVLNFLSHHTLWLTINTLCLSFSICLQLENFIQKSVRPNLGNIPSHVVHNQTATMLEIGTNLLTHTAEQTRKLNVVEAKVTSCCQFADLVTWSQTPWVQCYFFHQVLNQTSRIEIQLLENSLSTNKLEKELLLQTSEISRLRDKNR